MIAEEGVMSGYFFQHRNNEQSANTENNAAIAAAAIPFIGALVFGAIFGGLPVLTIELAVVGVLSLIAGACYLANRCYLQSGLFMAK
jgi:hypothetical protein